MKANWFLSIQEYKQGWQLIQQNRAWLEQSTLDTSAIYYCFVFIAFLTEKYEEAFHFIELVLDKASKQPKLRHAALLLKLCLYWDMEQYSLLESHIRSIYRKFNLEKEEHRLELLLVHSFKQLLQAPDDKAALVILLELKTQLNNFQEEAQHTELRILQMSGILLWLEHKKPKEEIL